MNKSESKYFNTALKMDEAFLKLLEEKDFEYITVKEICEKAGVNRSTFYLHYETIEDLLDESITGMNERFLEYFRRNHPDIAGNIQTADLEELYLVTPVYLTPYLEYIKEHRKVFLTAMKRSSTFRLADTYNRLFRYVLNPIMDRFQIPEKEKKYLLSFYIKGILAIINVWISENCEDDINFVIKMICERIQLKER